jgi:SAM-dependent methyltransferase
MATNFSATDPEGYERIMGRFSAQLAHPFLQFAGHPPNERILDVGCGTGRMSFALAERGDHATIVGIDVSDVYVDFAHSRNEDPRTTFEVADATALPFSDNEFDRAVSQLVLQFLPDPAPAAAEMLRVVRPGGIVAACVWDTFGSMSHLRMLWDTASAMGHGRERTLLRPLSTARELETMWHDVGFIDVAEDMITMRFSYENFDDYWSSLANGDGPPREFLGSLETGDQTKLSEQVRHVFLSGKPDGPRSFLAGAWICRGVVPGS